MRVGSLFFFFSSRRRHTIFKCDWSSDVCSSDLEAVKTRNGVLKYILKKAVRGVIPDELIDRKKQGFGVPVYEWYQTKFGDYLVKEMKDFCHSTDLFQFEGVLPFLKKRGWALLNVALWWKQYIGSAIPAPYGPSGAGPPEIQPVDLRSAPLSTATGV